MVDFLVQRFQNTPPLFLTKLVLVFELISTQEALCLFYVCQLEHSSIMKESLMVC
jgi:hypothetical protein